MLKTCTVNTAVCRIGESKTIPGMLSEGKKANDSIDALMRRAAPANYALGAEANGVSPFQKI
ncbi:unnamed protein product [Clonostachys rosea f. rosea IK726]|uniref:Uncharacterized protein n=1 Tax=Clonostachys rosea f. rosea IK726 TaxID=1349383 RepID=A0ACA9TN59_BIOOC|nr:unnamed protein product [Clonostachys rosea f. rosea IK726]